MRDKLPSLQEIQQDLLLSLASVVPFVGTVQHGQLRIRWSPTLRRLFDVATDRQRGRGGPLFNVRVLPEDLVRLREAVDHLLTHGDAMDVRYTWQDDQVQRSMRVCAVRQYRGNEIRVIGAFKDCTSRATNEHQLQISQEQLQSVGRLTLLGEVASGLAHELNQPLAAITTFAQAGERLLALPEPRLEKAQHVFREVSQQALRAGEIIRHMRSLIKRRAPQFEAVSIDELMRDFLALAEPMARTSQVQLKVRFAPINRQVAVDAMQFHQAMMILLQNALEATREQQSSAPQVRVESSALQEGVEFAIEDQGAGISDEVAAQVFKPFFSTKENGTGLGLVSCRNILEAHGSRLQFVNLPDGGSRFWFVLPYVPV